MKQLKNCKNSPKLHVPQKTAYFAYPVIFGEREFFPREQGLRIVFQV
jgi:hypothetical protein